MNSAKILVVEDEEPIRQMLLIVLENAGFDVQCAKDVLGARKSIAESMPDLILLDWMLPDISGVDWCRQLKKDSSLKELPVILLTARGSEEDKVRGLEVGADDYMTKPFSPREMVARIKAVLRRTGKLFTKTKVVVNDLILDTDSYQLSYQGRDVPLSPTEFKLMQFFMTHPEKVYNRTQLLDNVWGRTAYLEERTVDVHIRRLRKVLSEHGCGELVKTVRGFGYRFSS
ncbi:MAG TPA: phosphate regulon transcriptional regulatory protein PhoB [Methylococcaceae bacterium]|jgi:two-component system phosphate regulon response regulator PhoB|nr:phosphate regulon transcriptional regulatory protein PhoB [Methylococcaceae bacterium]HIN68850.1 phosphate regulon transcriptional regulatory protein PhoB [Methylococcales bacterium]HIA45488.1 phosphate regulon transcriptional regulatory protein PhoB [Methylococcaceae bacterium]HIB61732.1 phosphate regulon transcriptional regulatory protein PhoB [Methylococcaceae bacterium]HIO13319.1 phosphate regulon transcriptional regulatory protein PhoB [Methylococcales bacterium]